MKFYKANILYIGFLFQLICQLTLASGNIKIAPGLFAPDVSAIRLEGSGFYYKYFCGYLVMPSSKKNQYVIQRVDYGNIENCRGTLNVRCDINYSSITNSCVIQYSSGFQEGMIVEDPNTFTLIDSEGKGINVYRFHNQK